MSQVSQLPRPLLVALVGAAAVGALLLATRGGGSSTTPATQQQAASSGSSSKAASSKAHTGSKATAGSQTSKPGSSHRAGSQAAATGLPVGVDRALAAHKVVVILFWNKQGVDDQSVKAAVDGVSTRGGRVAKFTDTLGHLARYTRITGASAVVQTPTVLVVNRHRVGEVSTGLLDTASVDQLVVDALR